MKRVIDDRGVLTPGIFDTTFCEIKEEFTWNTRRRRLWNKFEHFLLDELSGRFVRGSSFYIGGSFLTLKDNPSDIDVTLAIPVPLVGLTAKSGLFELGTPDANRKFSREYETDFFISIDGLGHNFAVWYSYLGKKHAQVTGSEPTDRRGVVKVSCVKNNWPFVDKSEQQKTHNYPPTVLNFPTMI